MIDQVNATYNHELVKRMIEEAVKAEREACALLCEEERINATHYSAPTQSNWLAKKIRAR
jgi:hypothetical protein